MEKIKAVIRDIVHLENKPFFLCLFFLAYVVLFSYAIVRPVSNSILVTSFGPEGLPYAWIGTAILLPFIVYAYNRLISSYDYTRIFSGVVVLVCVFALVFWKLLQDYPRFTSVGFYIWKDIYIIILVEQIWALANTTYNSREAKTIYGLFTASGSIGAITGNIVTSKLSHSVGSINLLLSSIVLHLVVLALFLAAVRFRGAFERFARQSVATVSTYSKSGGFKLLFSSRYLIMIFCLIGLVQLITALADFQLNAFVKQSITGLDERTSFYGRIFAYINSVAFVFQLVLTAFFLRYLGLMKTHVMIPAVSLVFMILFAFSPVLIFITIGFISLKGLDYSLFRAAKEVLYIPLDEETQYKSKALIDVLSYRASKAFSSIFILVLGKLAIDYFMPINITMIVSFIVWLILVIAILRDYEKIRKPEESNG